jgi:hypothetical protein
MEVELNLKKVKEILLDNVPNEITAAHNAIAIYISLSDHAEHFNKSRFRDCLGSIQRHTFDAFVLSLCKLYEPPRTRYRNFSIPTAIQDLQRQVATLNINPQRGAILEKFIQREIDGSFTICSGSDLNRMPDLIIRYFADHYPHTPPRKGYELDAIFDALKVLRDKRVAHHEDNDLQGLSRTDLDGAIRLLAFADSVVNVLGYGFFGFSQQTIVSPEKFAPSHSWLWPQMQKMIEILKQ